MKSNILKYIFIVFVIGLVGFASYTIYQDEQKRKQEEGNKQTETVVKEPTIATDLRLGVVGYDTMNPILSTNKNIQEISRLVFDSLLTIDEKYKLQSDLATEWSRTGDTSYVLKLRQGVKWQDGTEFTAKDVQFTIDRLKDTPSIYSYNVQHVIGVEVIDEYTIKINLDIPVEFFEYNLTFPILSHNSYLEQDFKNSDRNRIPVATGMYKVASNESGSIILKKNQNWWNVKEKEPKLETITINLYSSMGEVYNGFKLGNIDLISTQTLNLEEYIGTIGYNKKEYPGREHDFLALNCANNLLSRVEIRKAIGFAVDRSGIMSSVSNGKYYTTDFPLGFGTWAYTQDSSSSGYNPDQAKQVLIDNGWQYKSKYWQKVENYRTVRLEFDLIVNAENAMQSMAAEVIKANLENVGIKIKIAKVSAKQYNSYLQNKNYEMILAGTNTSLAPDMSMYFGDNNIANYQNEEAYKIIQELRSISDEAMLKEKIKRLAEIYITEVPYISLYLNRNTVVYSSNLMGDINPNCYNIFYGIEKWYRQY